MVNISIKARVLMKRRNFIEIGTAVGMAGMLSCSLEDNEQSEKRKKPGEAISSEFGVK